MERQKHVTRERVMAAVERYLDSFASESIPVDALDGSWLVQTISGQTSDQQGEESHAEGHSEESRFDGLIPVEVLDEDDQLDMGALLSPALDSFIHDGAFVPADSSPGLVADLDASSTNEEGHSREEVAAPSATSESLLGDVAWGGGHLKPTEASAAEVVAPVAPDGKGPLAQKVDALGGTSLSEGGFSGMERDSSAGQASSGGASSSASGSASSEPLSVQSAPGVGVPLHEVEVHAESARSEAEDADATLARPLRPGDRPALDPSCAPSDDEVPETWGPYAVSGELARGGQGRILNAFDDVVGRPVALKILRKEGVKDTRLVGRFCIEAQVTGQLEHPNIVPVYELGWLENGLPYYIMKKVMGRTLKKVIFGLRKNRPEAVEKYNRVKLLTILNQVCQAISFAHDRGVIHRDLKPANIMLGDYGEVIVLDWGVAKVVGVPDDRVVDENHRPVKILHRSAALDTQAGTVEGTPAYMAPEQARGKVNQIDERSDVYALGAILYEILCYRPPFRGKEVREVLRKVVEEAPVPPAVVAPQNQIPDELESICLKALAKKASDRFQNVHQLHDEIAAFLEGTKRRAAAAHKVAEARAQVKQNQALKRELLLAKMVAKRAAEGIEGWEPIERKRGVWATRDRVLEVEARSHVTFGEAVGKFSQALAHEPENMEAREGLADLFMAQLKRAEEAGDRSEVIYLENMIRQYGGQKYAAFLKGDGYLSLETDVAGCEVWLYRYEERDRVLRPVEARHLGTAPVMDVRLPKGAYLVVLRAAGKRDVYYPIKLDRLEAWRAKVRLYSGAEIGEGFVYIPGGPVTLGGDLEAIDPLERELRTTADFAIQQFPVTFREYIEFLDAWLAADPSEAERHVPQVEAGVPLVEIVQGGYAPISDLIGPEGRALGRPGMEYDVPVFGIDFDSADSYCAWKSEVTGIEYRLATEEEWENAARGVDGRVFPWGNQFDPIFCKSRLSRPWSPEPEPVGSFPEDTSPYGVRDMAGGVREWVDGWFHEGQDLRVMRGGSYVDSERFLRCATRTYYDPYLGKRLAGFRCARSLG